MNDGKDRPENHGLDSDRLFWKRLAGFLQIRSKESPLALQLLGKVFLHAACVGLAAGVVSSLFVAGLELVQRVLLEQLTGYIPLRAAGEQLIDPTKPYPFRPWLLWMIPAVGALATGLLAKLAPETLGGGTDVIIGAFHNQNAVVRRRVPLVKVITSILTLGSGGSGGREGPTMLIGGALGSIIGRYLRVTVRERHILLVAGVAAGMSAVFRTPLGAAILAVEILHRDDFESDALVPSVLASVISYSVFISLFGEETLFAHASSYPFYPSHLFLYALMALLISLAGAGFLKCLHSVQHAVNSVRLPEWSKPAFGGLVLGVLSTIIIVAFGLKLGVGQGLGILGGGYGAAQIAITGADWLPMGWLGVMLLILFGLVKIVATSLTVGTGGSAGDFGPSLVIGGIFGGAFGRAAQLLLHDPRIDPGAFALVGMGTMYGGLAHVPIGSLVMVCELAGSYDLLVPLMLAEGIAYIALRNHSLYHAQVSTRRDSGAHREDLIFDVLKDIPVMQVMKKKSYVSFLKQTPASEALQKIAGSEGQHTYPVLSSHGALIGVVYSEILRTFTTTPDLGLFTIVYDFMEPAISVKETDDLNLALKIMLEHNVREIVVTDVQDKIVGFLDEAGIGRMYYQTSSGKE